MSSAADTEALLQAYGVAYDPHLLTKQRVAFALLLRKYLQKNNCLDEQILERFDVEPDLSNPTHSLIKVCLESAWNDMEFAEKWNQYKSSR
ncbi:hypothetical protein H1230_21475 [Paenibacillus sp. 19GGS1-52]|uniref:hypothetical protein n=1 Tax=Paenibacillus sp. 19GGS1-52 TaxID=2758563 RepID=UPI001EFB2861|nr:hypothetical protein [Paenibacillus sp. 19GGS1-52]ULO05627.1 hypothetical protein H1230_21475 [Paenibacillus sp. 19GGS1-52]